MIVKTFEREANILATLSHPAIPQIFDYFTQGDRSFLVQEFIEGKDLEAHLAECPACCPKTWWWIGRCSCARCWPTCTATSPTRSSFAT